MAFEIKDWFHSYTNRGGIDGLFNVARTEDGVSSYPKYYGFVNEVGAYVIMRETTSSTVKIYQYYASKNASSFATSWTNRGSLTYVEYNDMMRTLSRQTTLPVSVSTPYLLVTVFL